MIGNICPNLVMLASIFYYTNIVIYQLWESLFSLHLHSHQESKYVKFNQDTKNLYNNYYDNVDENKINSFHDAQFLAILNLMYL